MAESNHARRVRIEGARRAKADAIRTAAIKARNTLRDQMREMLGDDEIEWRETVFWDAYSALCAALD